MARDLDRGMVAVLDRRLLTKGYGSFIRASMPSMWPTTDPEVARACLRRLAAAVGASGPEPEDPH